MKANGPKLNPFIQPSALTALRLKDLCALAANAYLKDWTPATAGNFSIRQTNNIIWMSPSGKDKGKLKPNEFIAVDLSSKQPLNPMAAKVSDETPLHLAIYSADPSASAIAHVHSPELLRLSANKEQLFFEGQELQKALGETTHETKITLNIIDNTQDMQWLASQLSTSLDLKHKLLILKNHGVYSWGTNPEEAFRRLEALEALCRTQVTN